MIVHKGLDANIVAFDAKPAALGGAFVPLTNKICPDEGLDVILAAKFAKIISIDASGRALFSTLNTLIAVDNDDDVYAVMLLFPHENVLSAVFADRLGIEPVIAL